MSTPFITMVGRGVQLWKSNGDLEYREAFLNTWKLLEIGML